MTTKVHLLTTIALAAPLLLSGAETAQTSATSPAPALSPIEQTIKDIKNPTPWLSWGGDLRLRNEYFNNAQTLASDPKLHPLADLHSQDYFRFRGRIWASLMPTDELSINGRLAGEPREWMEPSSSGNFRASNPPGRSGFESRFGIIDSFNVQIKKPFDMPISLIVGRQDITMGDGWLVLDGTPNDGSWTYFMDAARLTLDLKEQHTTVDLIGIVQNARPDAWLPTLGNSTKATKDGDPSAYFLTDQNEKGAILWIANKSIPTANMDAYFIYKHDTRVNNKPSATFGDDGDIFTVGGRLSGLLEDHWKYSAEGAYQLGRKRDPLLNKGGKNPALVASAEDEGFRDLRAFGVNTKFAYLFNDPLNNQLSVSYEYLSGDDNGTGTDEMFDVLWGRWPRWSELYIPYSYIPETRTGQMGNYHRVGPGWSLTPVKNLDFALNYYALFADQSVPTRANTATAFAGGDFRGHYLQATLKYKFGPHMSGHLWGETVFPGDFYASEHLMTFLRAELLFTF
jgi:hypothetical protein